MAAKLQDTISQEFETIVGNVTSLINCIKAENTGSFDGVGSRAGPPGAIPELYVERILGSAERLLGVIQELKRTALLNNATALRKKVARVSLDADANALTLERAAAGTQTVDAPYAMDTL